MSVLRAFRKRPPYPIPSKLRVLELACPPRSYVRAFLPDGRALWAPCYAWAPGPQQLATTGDGSFTTLYGESWMLQMCPDGTWNLYHAIGSAMQLVPWDVTPQAAGESGRHPTLAFDQAARPAMAWEETAGIFLREFDEIAGEYQFIGPLAGHDPVLLCDATVNYRVGGSDVVLFYLNATRSRLMYRVQNENFLIEHEHHDFGTAVVLDASDIGGYRLQLKYSDDTGEVIPEGGSFRALLSDVYPIYVRSRAVAVIHALEDGVLELVTVTRDLGADAITGAVGTLEDGTLLYVIIIREYDDAMIGSVTALRDGVLLYVIIDRDGADDMTGTVASLDDGAYTFVMLYREPPADEMTASVGSLEDGAYAAA